MALKFVEEHLKATETLGPYAAELGDLITGLQSFITAKDPFDVVTDIATVIDGLARKGPWWLRVVTRELVGLMRAFEELLKEGGIHGGVPAPGAGGHLGP